MYSEEEVLLILRSHTTRLQNMVNNKPYEDFDTWFNQFEKKVENNGK